MKLVFEPATKELKYQTETIKYWYAKVFYFEQILDQPSLPYIIESTPRILNIDLERQN